MKKRSIGCLCSCEADCSECGGCTGLECVISDVTGWQTSKIDNVQSGAAECIDGDWRIPVGTADGSGVYRDSAGAVLPSGTALYVTFDGPNCGREWSSSWRGRATNPNDFQEYTAAITGSFDCNTCSGAQTGIARQYFWEDDGVAICSFTGVGCGGNPDTNVCDAPDDDCAATDQICEKVSITSFTAENDHATHLFEFDQVAGYKPHWYDSNKGLVPCTVVYTNSTTPASNYTRLGFAEIEGTANSYSNTVRLFTGRVNEVLADGDLEGKFREVGNPCSGTHSGSEAAETPFVGSIGDLDWSYSQAANECEDEPSQNCCGVAECGYTGMTAFTIEDTDSLAVSTYEWVMQSYIKTSSCTFTMSMDDVSGNGGGTTTWYMTIKTFPSGGRGQFVLEAAFGDTYNNGFIDVTFTDCALIQSVNGAGNFGIGCPITATFTDAGSC